MLFSYLLLGLVLAAVAALLGFGMDGIAYCLVVPLLAYFCDVTFSGIKGWTKHRRLNYQLVDLAAFLFAVVLFSVVTEIDDRLEVPMYIVGLVAYFAVAFWASKKFPMSPQKPTRYHWFNGISLMLPLLWSRHTRHAKEDSVAD